MSGAGSSAPKTFATLATAGSYPGPAGTPLVGRMVANRSFVEALLAHATFERFVFFVGEAADRRQLDELGWNADPRVQVADLLTLPELLAQGALDVLHHNSHLERYLDLVWLRDRHATRTVPVTAQIHSLSYPRAMGDYLRVLCLEPRACDAIFCSSAAGKRVVERCFEDLAKTLRGRGVELTPPAWQMPVVPLGIDAKALGEGSGARLRERLQVPANAHLVLSMARFSEYDKMDLFPLVRAFAGLVRAEDPARPAHLALAGARQGTETPEMLALWARALGLEGRVHFHVDFPEAEKPDLLAAADCFASPCDNPQETFGITVVEAMAAGVPVVVSDYDGYRETAGGGAGLLVETHTARDRAGLSDLGPLLYERPLHLFLGQSTVVSPQALEEGLLSLYRDPERARELGARGRAKAHEQYDWPVVIARYEEHWEALAQAPFEPRPKDRAGEHHPLAMDFDTVFGHYPSATLDAERPVRRTPLAEELLLAGVDPPIHRGLTELFDSKMVRRALSLAAEPRPLASLGVALPGERPDWQRSLFLAWLEKHGLVAPV